MGRESIENPDPQFLKNVFNLRSDPDVTGRKKIEKTRNLIEKLRDKRAYRRRIAFVCWAAAFEFLRDDGV